MITAILVDGRLVQPLAHADALGRVYRAAPSAPRTLYVSRPVRNAAEIIAWAKARGFKSCLPPEDMHVTVCFSKAPMDWNRAGGSYDTVTAFGSQPPSLLGEDGAAVIKFEAAVLQDRRRQFRDAGASWDYESYNPHITLSYDPPDPLPLEPYTGQIELGPEIFAEVVSKWASDLRELVQGKVRAFAFDPNQPRDEDGKWTDAGGGHAGKGATKVWRRINDKDPDLPARPELEHKTIRAGGEWGYSHSNSHVITGSSAELMGLDGWKTYEGTSPTQAKNFLHAIHADVVGAEEVLYHGFADRNATDWQVGDTFGLPLTATSGDRDHSIGYGHRLDVKDEVGTTPTVFVFPKGTPIAAYSIDRSHEFGYYYNEAITAGKFRVVEVDRDYINDGSWGKSKTVRVLLEPVATFDPDSKSWKDR